MVNLFLSLLRLTMLFSTAAALFCIPTNRAPEFQYVHILTNIYRVFLYSNHPNEQELVSPWDFDGHFLMIGDAEHLSMCLLAICISSLAKSLFKPFAQEFVFENYLSFFQATCVSMPRLYLLSQLTSPLFCHIDSIEGSLLPASRSSPPAHAFLALCPNTKGQFPCRKK